MTRYLIIFTFMLFITTPAQAQDKEEKVPEFEETPITKWIDAENRLLDTLPKENQRVFFVMRNKHSVIRSVKVVSSDVGNAVKACGKANPDYKADISGRFKEWQNAVNPILEESDKFLKAELKEQEAFHLTDYRYVMKLNDKAYNFSESKVTKKPVTSMEACEKLYKSMDRTEDKLVTLLQDILLPEEVVRKRAERQGS